MIYLQDLYMENVKETGEIFQKDTIKSLLPPKNNTKPTHAEFVINEESGKSDKSLKSNQDLKHFYEINQTQASKILKLMNTVQTLQAENYQLYIDNFKKEGEYQAIKREIEILLYENQTLISKNKELIQQIEHYIRENQRLLSVVQNLKEQLHSLQTEAQKNTEETQVFIHSLQDQILFLSNKIKNLQEYISTLSELLESEN
jgi:uncharacterized protein YoxC